LLEIYKELYKAMPYLFEDIKLSSFFSGVGAFEKALDMLEDYINNGNVINQVNFTQPPII
jgi:DNA (cytosine-5)-methyltransferase 1